MERTGRDPLERVIDELRRIFGDRLEAVVSYGRHTDGPIPTLVLTRTLTTDDLTACAARCAAWRAQGAATPLVLTRDEFSRSLDAFPMEYGEILDHHRVRFGAGPFEGLTIRPEDARRACEVQTKSLLVHLRENYIESGARPGAVAALVVESAPAFAALLRRLARLDQHPAEHAAEIGAYAQQRPGLAPHVVGDVLALVADPQGAAVDAARLFPDYLAAVARLAEFVDHWKRP